MSWKPWLPWQIGEVISRDPYLIRDALEILAEPDFNGDLISKEQKEKFEEQLNRKELVNYSGSYREFRVSKWCNVFSRFGFVTPKISRVGNLENMIDPLLLPIIDDLEDLTGRPFEITPNGRRLLASTSRSAIQECFLRSILCYRVPNKRGNNHVVKNQNFKDSFTPINFLLDILHNLSSLGEEEFISFSEFSFFVQTSSPSDGIDRVVQKIVDFRMSREASKSVRKYEEKIHNKICKEVYGEIKKKQAYWLYNEARCTIPCLNATGLFSASTNRGVTILETQKDLAEMILREKKDSIDFNDYIRTQICGAALPTDNIESSRAAIRELIEQIQARKIECAIPYIDESMNLRDTEVIRHNLKDEIEKRNELEYSERQNAEIDEIIEYLNEFMKPKASDRIPAREGPAYFEWSIWRSFLAIAGSSVNARDARNFKVDMDFKPLGFAKRGVPDMVFEFDDRIVVVEVTLTKSSRQEAVEGEPVRRHVADCMKNSKKPVYCLFIAPEIDNNTAHTFLSRIWYLTDRKDDKKIFLKIIPVALGDYIEFLKFSPTPKRLFQYIEECQPLAQEKSTDSPEWKRRIASLFRSRPRDLAV